MPKQKTQGKAQPAGGAGGQGDPSHLSSTVPPNPAFLQDVTDYFIKCWPNTPAKFFTPTCPIRKSYTSMQWYNVADALNGAPWTPRNVIISHAQIGDASINDIADVAALITLLSEQAKQTVAAWKPTPVLPHDLTAE
jgi:hypothetical protein